MNPTESDIAGTAFEYFVRPVRAVGNKTIRRVIP